MASEKSKTKRMSHRKIPYSTRFKYGYYQFFDHILGRERFFKMTKKSRKRFYQKLRDNLEKKGEGKSFQVKEYEHLSEKEFKTLMKKGFPFVVKNGAKEWGCVNHWSTKYFKEKHGSDQISYLDQTDIGSSEVIETTLKSVLDDIDAGKPTYYRFYPLLSKHPEHIADFDYKFLRKNRGWFNVAEGFQVFISSKGGFTPIHNASSHNIFIQAEGEKKWILYPVEYSCIIDPSPARNMYRSAPIRNGKDFNAFKNNFDDYPLYKFTDRYEVHLKAGDILYNPPYFWHTVENPTVSIGVGYRFITPVSTWFRHPLYFFLELLAFKPPFWKSWRKYSDINLIQMMETGKIKHGSKSSVS